MVITKTLPSEAAKVLDKGVRKMTPRIMTWYQYGEAALHYMQQVKGGDCVCVWGGGGRGVHTGNTPYYDLVPARGQGLHCTTSAGEEGGGGEPRGGGGARGVMGEEGKHR
jgi:hypothetical protein